MFSLESSVSNINVYCLTTIGTSNMITQNGKTMASYSDNVDWWADTIALFTTGTVPPPSSSLLGWNYRGCYTDAWARTLGNLVQVPGGPSANTIEACLAACQAAGYSLAGVEYSYECCKLSTTSPPDSHVDSLLQIAITHFATVEAPLLMVINSAPWRVLGKPEKSVVALGDSVFTAISLAIRHLLALQLGISKAVLRILYQPGL